MQLPEQPTQVGQPTDQAQQIINAIEEVYAPRTAYRDDSPIPAVGAAPPVAQPGVPPMSQRATDISRVMIAAGIATVPPGLIAIGVLVASEHANPTIIGMICAAPAAIAIPILAVAGVLRRAKEVVDAAPATHHHHYQGDVSIDQRSINSRTGGIIAHTRNQG